MSTPPATPAPENHPLLHGRFSVMNGLRGVTLFWVMFVHLPSFAVPAMLMHAHDKWRFGVDFFFAISGFLVTRSLYQCYAASLKRGTGAGWALVEYLIRRVSRIVPPYYVVLALVGALAVATKGGLYEQLSELGTWLLAFPLFFANYLIPVHETPKTLEILWSVSFQEQFYTLIGLYFVFTRKHLKELLLASGLFSIAARVFSAFALFDGHGNEGRYEMWLHLNFDGIAWGCLAWLHYDRLGALFSTRGRAAAATALILVGDALVILLPSRFATDHAWAIVAAFKAPLLALTVRAACELESSQGLLGRFLRGRWLGEIGVASYEIYLLHVIVYGFLDKLRVTSGPVFLAASYAAGIGAGLLFYRVFGKPSQDFAKRWLRKGAAGAAGLLAKLRPRLIFQ
jgi:peptidoglycan/LPS O-acetylase OafA/YrhL